MSSVSEMIDWFREANGRLFLSSLVKLLVFSMSALVLALNCGAMRNLERALLCPEQGSGTVAVPGEKLDRVVASQRVQVYAGEGENRQKRGAIRLDFERRSYQSIDKHL